MKNNNVRTLNLCCGNDKWGTDRLDWKDYQNDGIFTRDLNENPKLPYDDNVFEQVRFRNTIALMLYPQEILEECYRVLKPGGTLDITSSSYEGLLNSITVYKVRDNTVRFGKAMVNNGKHYQMFNIQMLENRLAAAGFKIIEKREKMHFWHGTILLTILHGFLPTREVFFMCKKV